MLIFSPFRVPFSKIFCNSIAPCSLLRGSSKVHLGRGEKCGSNVELDSCIHILFHLILVLITPPFIFPLQRRHLLIILTITMQIVMQGKVFFACVFPHAIF